MSDIKHERVAAHEVASYLRQHPTFLTQFPDLAQALVMPREEGPAASLASYQLDVLRDKNRELTRRLHELSGNAQVNEQLAVRTHHLGLALMRANTPADTLRALAACLSEDFHGEVMRLILFAPVTGLEAPWLRVLPLASAELEPFRDFLAGSDALCGRLNQEKLDVLFGTEPAREQIACTALLPLPGLGLLAVASHDPNRFFPGMGTLFLDMMRDALVTALARFGTN